jgi:hypothetical protein
MSGEISVVGWEAANTIAKHLVTAGYEVKITSDGEKIHQTEVGGSYELSYMVTFAHPIYDGSYFELVQEEFEGTRTWEDIKAELEDGLEHLNDQPIWVIKGDTDGDKPVKKKVKK